MQTRGYRHIAAQLKQRLLVWLLLRQANQALGREAQSFVFLGVNTNGAAHGVADVMATTQKWQPDEVDNCIIRI